LEDPVAEIILKGEIQAGDTIMVAYEAGKEELELTLKQNAITE
jgi:hypothetical protein